MDEDISKLPFFTRVFFHIIKFVTRFSIPVLIVIFLLTAFFATRLVSLKIDADVNSFASGVEQNPYVETPSEKPSGEPLKYITTADEGIGDEHYGYTERSESERLHADAPENLRTGIKAGEYPDEYTVLFTSDLLYEQEVLDLIESVKNDISSLDFVGPCLSAFDFVTAERVGSRIAVVPMSPVNAGENWDSESAEIFRTRLENDKVARGYLYSDDCNSILLYWRTTHYTAEELELLNAMVDPLRDYGRVCINGGGVIADRVSYYISRDLGVLLVLCFIIILITYYLSFRSKRSVLVPASMSLMGIVWTLGTMALMGYKMTIISILTPCLVLTLGSSYSIHMMSEYFAEAKYHDKTRLNIAYAKITKTILSAAMTTIVGFVSMLICRTPQLREFGVSVSIGVAYCAVLAIVYLPAILSIQRYPSDQKFRKIERGIINKFVDFILKVIFKYWLIVLIVVVLIVAGFLYAKDRVDYNANYMEYFPQGDDFIKDSLYFARKMGGTAPYYMTIRAPEGEEGFFLKPENLKKVYEFEETVMASCTDIVQSLSFSQYVSFLNYVYTGEEGIPSNAGLMNLLYRLLMQMESQIGSDVLSIMINDDATEITLSMRNYDSWDQDLTTTASAARVEETLSYYRYLLPEGTSSRIHCTSSDMVKVSDMMISDQNMATIISSIGIIIIATFTLTSFFRGLAAIIPVVIGIMFNYIFMLAFGIPFDLVTIGFSSVTIGAGIDDALHFLLRYRLHKRENPRIGIDELITVTMKETGRPIILTSLAVDAGLIVLVFASYTPIRYYGMLMVVSLTVAMLSTLFILPVVMLLSGRLKERIQGRKKIS